MQPEIHLCEVSHCVQQRQEREASLGGDGRIEPSSKIIDYFLHNLVFNSQQHIRWHDTFMFRLDIKKIVSI